MKQKNGQRASSTGTIYGIYDLSGGTWERTTVYPHNPTYDDTDAISDTTTNLKTAGTENYKLNTKIYGDAIRETSTAGTGSTSWYGDYSYFPGLYYPFSFRGGSFWHTGGAGLFCFNRINGDSSFGNGFRAVLVAQ